MLATALIAVDVFPGSMAGKCEVAWSYAHDGTVSFVESEGVKGVRAGYGLNGKREAGRALEDRAWVMP